MSDHRAHRTTHGQRFMVTSSGHIRNPVYGEKRIRQEANSQLLHDRMFDGCLCRLEGGRPARTARNAKVVEAGVNWNYTTYLNIIFLGVAAVLIRRYFQRR